MIDPRNLSGCDPEELAMFAVCVHGKLAAVQACKLNGILQALAERGESSPLSAWAKLGLEDKLVLLRKHGIGQYHKILRAWMELGKLSPPYAVDDLRKVYGIGPKTARFITVYSGSDPNRAILDVHVMRWLRLTTGVRYWRTDSTPQGEKAYAAAEEAFLKLAAERGMTPAQLDTEIWKIGQRRPGGKKE